MIQYIANRLAYKQFTRMNAGCFVWLLIIAFVVSMIVILIFNEL